VGVETVSPDDDIDRKDQQGDEKHSPNTAISLTHIIDGGIEETIASVHKIEQK
jgi:hypothetical protein